MQQKFWLLSCLGISLVAGFAWADGVETTPVDQSVNQYVQQADSNLPKLCDQVATIAAKKGIAFSNDSAIATACATGARTLSEAGAFLDGQVKEQLPNSQGSASLTPALREDFTDELADFFRAVPDFVELAKHPSWQGVRGAAHRLFGGQESSAGHLTFFLMNAGVRVAADSLRTVVSIAQGLSFQSASKAVTSGLVTLVKAPFKTIGGSFRVLHTLIRFVKANICMGVTNWVADALPKIDVSVTGEFQSLIDKHAENAKGYRDATSADAAGMNASEREVLAKAEELRIRATQEEMNTVHSWLAWLPSCSHIMGAFCSSAIGYIDINHLTEAESGSWGATAGNGASLALTGLCWYGVASVPLCGAIYAAADQTMMAWRNGDNDLDRCLDGFGLKLDAWGASSGSSVAAYRYGNSTSGISQTQTVHESPSGQSFQARECCVCRQTFYKDGYFGSTALGSINSLGVIEEGSADNFAASSCAHQADKGFSDDPWWGAAQKYTGMTPKFRPALRDPNYNYYRYTDCRRVVVMGSACAFPAENTHQFDREVWDEGSSHISSSPLVAPKNDPQAPSWVK